MYKEVSVTVLMCDMRVFIASQWPDLACKKGVQRATQRIHPSIPNGDSREVSLQPYRQAVNCLGQAACQPINFVDFIAVYVLLRVGPGISQRFRLHKSAHTRASSATKYTAP